MATSGSVTFTLTAREAVTTALELVKTTMIGSDASALDAALAQRHANLMLKTWGANERLWITTEGTITLLAATASYALTTARRVSSVRRRTSGVDTPLIMLSRREYNDYPSKAATGMPFQAFFDAQRTVRTLYVVGVPDATIALSTTLPYTYDRVIEDISDLANDIDIPQEWLEAFVYSLAARLLIPYGRYVVDPASAAEIKGRAQELYGQLSAQDDESGSIFLQPA